MTTAPPNPTPILRIVHVDTLPTLVRRGGLHAPNFTPPDGLLSRPIHDVNVQASRGFKAVTKGPGGTIHDYVPFYFGRLSVMLYQLKTGYVANYTEGQEPIVYLVTSAQKVAASGHQYVFTDGHGLAAYTDWHDDLGALSEVSWDVVNERYWRDTSLHPDRKRQKQAEFLVHEFVPWVLVDEIVVINTGMKGRVEASLTALAPTHYPVVTVRSDWYY